MGCLSTLSVSIFGGIWIALSLILLEFYFIILFCARWQTSFREDSSLPPRDDLMQFLLNSTNHDLPKCSNCDRNEKSTMFYCNTCGNIYVYPFFHENIMYPIQCLGWWVHIRATGRWLCSSRKNPESKPRQRLSTPCKCAFRGWMKSWYPVPRDGLSWD